MITFQRLMPLFSDKIVYAANLDKCFDLLYNIPIGQIHQLTYTDKSNSTSVYVIRNKSEENADICWSHTNDITGPLNIFNGDEYAIFRPNRTTGKLEIVSEWFSDFNDAKMTLIEIAKKHLTDDGIDIKDIDFNI